MKIFITGPAGSGKSTQAKRLAEKYNLCYISGGAVARKIACEDSLIGRAAKEAMEKGELIDNQVEACLINEKIASNECENGYIMDGFPRSMDQLKYFTPDFDKIFYLDVSDREVQKRLVERDRLDDTPEAIATRLQIFHDETEDVLNLFKDRGVLVKINGEQGEDAVFAEIEENLPKE